MGFFGVRLYGKSVLYQSEMFLRCIFVVISKR